jgi:hypothetical protein
MERTYEGQSYSDGGLYSFLTGKVLVRLTNKQAKPGHRHGAVLDTKGNVIGDAQDYTYGGAGFAVFTAPFAGYVPLDNIVFTD